MSTANKKRHFAAAEVVLDSDQDEDWKEKMLALERENAELKRNVETLQAQLAESRKSNVSNADDKNDEEDDKSVCDGSSWSKKYFMLKQYKHEHGDCMVPFKYPKLGNWVNEQRKAFKNQKLSKERTDKLNKIGFYWGKGHPKPPTWDDYYQQLKTHFHDFGHCNVHVDPDPMRRSDLAAWVVTQRKQGKRLEKMMPTSLSRDQYKLLDDIAFPWMGGKKRRCL